MAEERNVGAVHRVLILKIIMIVLFVVYTGRLFSMQILSGDLYLSRAQSIARQTRVIPAQRGEIYDRNFDVPLVLNTESFVVSVTPAEIPRGEIEDLIDRLSLLLNINRDVISRRLPASIHHLYQPVEITSNVSFSTIAAIAEQAHSLPGVSWQSRPIRNYTDISSLSHIIGYVGNITREELTVLFNRGYQQGDIIGKSGIERQYDELLRGSEGRETRTVDVWGRRMSGDFNRIAPDMGRNLVLTIDRDIQLLAEKALGRRMGAVVVLKPATGEILAMVSYPWYDPTIFNLTDFSAEFQALTNNPQRPFLNRAIQSSYPPASSFKIVMSAGILSESSFPINQTVECRGEIHFGDRVWRCHNRSPGHGRVNLRGALAQSCNIYYWTIGRDYLGVDNIIKYSQDFGFGRVSGIDIPGEVSGLVPTPQWRENRFHVRWMGGDTMNISIGQGDMAVTPLQMANMVAMTVNDGIIYRPHFLSEVRDPISGALEVKTLPEIFHQSDISPSVFAALREDMRNVVTNGTVQYPMNMRALQVEVAGKTGTGEAGLVNGWHSWFASYAPYQTNDPYERVVVSVLVEASNPWEWWAPYASAIIYQGIFANQTYEEAIQALGFRDTNDIQGRRE